MKPTTVLERRRRWLRSRAQRAATIRVAARQLRKHAGDSDALHLLAGDLDYIANVIGGVSA